MSITKSFKDLIVWQKLRDLAIAVYKLTEVMKILNNFLNNNGK